MQQTSLPISNHFLSQVKTNNYIKWTDSSKSVKRTEKTNFAFRRKNYHVEALQSSPINFKGFFFSNFAIRENWINR